MIWVPATKSKGERSGSMGVALDAFGFHPLVRRQLNAYAAHPI